MVVDIINRYFKVQLPGYLKSLPLPKTLAGFAELTRDQWLELIPFLLFLFVLLYLIVSPCIGMLTHTKQRRPRVNRKQRMSEAKVADTFDMEDLDKALKEKNGSVSYCRCWKSNTVQCTYTCIVSTAAMLLHAVMLNYADHAPWWAKLLYSGGHLAFFSQDPKELAGVVRLRFWGGGVPGLGHCGCSGVLPVAVISTCSCACVGWICFAGSEKELVATFKALQSGSIATVAVHVTEPNRRLYSNVIFTFLHCKHHKDPRSYSDQPMQVQLCCFMQQ
jgi:hypothetical protein